MSWFHWKNRMATEFARSQIIGLSFCGPDAGTLQAQTAQHCQAEDCLAIDMERFTTGVHW